MSPGALCRSRILKSPPFGMAAQFVVAPLSIVSAIFGYNLYSAYLAPFRWCARLMEAIGSIPAATTTYIARRNAWSILQIMAMGLEGYPFQLPQVEQSPAQCDDASIKCESISKGAVDRAMKERSAWISRHFENVSETFSKMTITAADITSLLRIVEADQSLVHGAYYTDEECIARIADWISGKG